MAPRLRLIWLLIAVLLHAAGCGAAPRPGSLDSIVAHYSAEHYVAAEREALDLVAASDDRVQREQAAYLAGLSAYQLGHFDDAQRHLRLAVASEDESLAARSRAMLGLIHLHRRESDEAAALLEEAAMHLDDDNARQAVHHAGIARRGPGGTVRASSPSLRLPGSAARSGDGAAAEFVLQFGAFYERPRADRVARDAARVASQHGLRPVRVIPSSDSNGRRLYLVHVGQFDSEAVADRIRERLHGVDCFVAEIAVSGH